MDNDSKIIALATPKLRSALAIIRISGKDVVNLFKNYFSTKEKLIGNKFYYGKIIDNKNKVIDEVIALIYMDNKSYTGEEMVEVICHGNPFIIDNIINFFISKGCKKAKPGEFTLRSFLNNKINLIQAESINELINANTPLSIDRNLSNILDKKTKQLLSIKNKLIEINANIKINIDYPEYYDIEDKTLSKISKNINEILSSINIIQKNSTLINNYNLGIKTSIIGKPNVGKSSLFNCLLNQNKAIVSKIKGTTRDLVEGEVLFDNILVKLTDTAGIRKTKNIIEIEGIKKTNLKIKESDLILFLIDKDINKISKKEKEILNLIDKEKTLIIRNKKDLIKKLPLNLTNNNILISTKNNEIESLIKTIKLKFKTTNFSNKDEFYISTSRQLNLINLIKNNLEDIISKIKENQSIEIISFLIEEVINLFNELIGIDVQDEVINKMFENYCVGK